MRYDPPLDIGVTAPDGTYKRKRRTSAAQAALALASELALEGVYTAWGWRLRCSRNEKGLWSCEAI